MAIHVLNGDCLAHIFQQSGIEGEYIICRECLMDGPTQATSLADFWAMRNQFITKTYSSNTAQYQQMVVEELEKILHLPTDVEACLWFEDDLFCQVNLWFVLNLLAPIIPAQQIYRVFPIVAEGDHWRGFGASTPALLEQSFAQRIAFSEHDLDLGLRLWEAYRVGDWGHLENLSTTPSACFRYLPEIGQAQRGRFAPEGELGRPERLVLNILQHQTTDFQELFTLFGQQAGYYGFGDLQIKAMYDRLLPLLPQSDSTT